MRASENTQDDFYRGWYYQSNGAITNVVHRGLDLYFQGHQIYGNIIILQYLENGES